MVFATDREIGLELLPLDGNPYKIVGITGHSQKVRHHFARALLRTAQTRVYKSGSIFADNRHIYQSLQTDVIYHRPRRPVCVNVENQFQVGQ